MFVDVVISNKEESLGPSVPRHLKRKTPRKIKSNNFVWFFVLKIYLDGS